MQVNTQTLRFFAELIEREIGIVYHEATYFQLESRLKDLAARFDLGSPEALAEKVRKGLSEEMRVALLDYATNNETSFFRDPHVFDAVQTVILPEMLKTRGAESLRIWSAACSFGQEIYSLAMLLEESLSSPRFSILATDVSGRALAAARAGIFGENEVRRGLSPERLARHFRTVPVGGKELPSWQARPELRQKMELRKLNLLEPFAGLGPFDLILCRNVLIYQTVERKREIVQRLRRELATDGWLVLGAAESLFGLSEEFDMVRTDKVTVYRNQRRAAA